MLFRNEYAFLSNMYTCNVKYNGVVYPSAENAFQAAKCINTADKEIFKTCTPVQAKQLGRKIQLRPDWDKERVHIMLHIVYNKFSQNNKLKQKLLNVTEPIVEENTWNDKFWGVCNNVGQNMLGRILTFVRNKLKE